MVNTVNTATAKPKVKSLFNKNAEKIVDNGYLENKLQKRKPTRSLSVNYMDCQEIKKLSKPLVINSKILLFWQKLDENLQYVRNVK